MMQTAIVGAQSSSAGVVALNANVPNDSAGKSILSGDTAAAGLMAAGTPLGTGNSSGQSFADTIAGQLGGEKDAIADAGELGLAANFKDGLSQKLLLVLEEKQSVANTSNSAGVIAKNAKVAAGKSSTIAANKNQTQQKRDAASTGQIVVPTAQVAVVAVKPMPAKADAATIGAAGDAGTKSAASIYMDGNSPPSAGLNGRVNGGGGKVAGIDGDVDKLPVADAGVMVGVDTADTKFQAGILTTATADIPKAAAGLESIAKNALGAIAAGPAGLALGKTAGVGNVENGTANLGTGNIGAAKIGDVVAQDAMASANGLSVLQDAGRQALVNAESNLGSAAADTNAVALSTGAKFRTQVVAAGPTRAAKSAGSGETNSGNAAVRTKSDTDSSDGAGAGGFAASLMPMAAHGSIANSATNTATGNGHSGSDGAASLSTAAAGSVAAGSAGHDNAFARLDAASGAMEAMPHTLVSATAQQVEVGVSSPTHGWVSVRAEMTDGTVQATLTGSNATAEHSLRDTLPGMSAYLEQQRVALSGLSVSSSGETQMNLGQQPGQNAQQQSQQSAGMMASTTSQDMSGQNSGGMTQQGSNSNSGRNDGGASYSVSNVSGAAYLNGSSVGPMSMGQQSYGVGGQISVIA